MNTPTLQYINRFKYALPGILLSDGWRIPHSKHDDIIWNIVLAYLNSIPSWDTKKLNRLIKSITGGQKVNENIKDSIKICNPFLHRSACFCDKELSELVTVFKKRVENYIRNHNNLLLLSDEYLQSLEASSRVLCCNIVVLSFPFLNCTNIKKFPYFIRKETARYPKTIVLFYELIFINGSRNPQLQFSFCIPKAIGMQKQRHALIEILERTPNFNINAKIIQKISRLPHISDNFIIPLLKTDLGKIITFIYKSPYVISKLTDAGFLTDPRAKDKAGKSAFFHALKSKESHLVSVLYDHAANACLQADASVRSPDPLIVENLLCLKDYLKSLEKDLDSKDLSEKSRSMFRDICRFNEFQIEMCKNINHIRLQLNYYDQTEKEFEAIQRKETILIILTTYKKYFDLRSRQSESSFEANDNISQLEEFYKHEEYFDKLDFSSAVMFFDNLFLLKERMELQNDAYLDVESKFFLYIFFRKYLEQHGKEKYFYFVYRWITFQERLSLQKHVCTFKEILEETKLSNDNVVCNIPERAVRTLTNIPQLYGQFLIFRLQHYLNTATGVSIKDLKSILIIERCLQVMGECCKESDFNSVQKIITLSLPKDFIKHLKQIRNRLSNIKPHELLYRNNLEEDVELFIGIQKELSKLKKVLLPVYSAHKYELDHFLLLHFVKSVCKARKRSILEKYENQLKIILPIPEREENQLPISACKTQWKRYFDNMHISLTKEIKDLNSNATILTKKTTQLYRHIIQNMIDAIRESLNNFKAYSPENVVDLESKFWCLENILTYISKDQKLTEFRRKLVLMLKNRKFLFTEFRGNDNAYQFQKNDNLTSTATHDLPITHAIVANQQQQPEENYDNCHSSNNNFLKFGFSLNIESGISTSTAKNEDTVPSKKRIDCSETETDGEHFENSFLQNMFLDNFSEETIVEESREEGDGLCESIQCKKAESSETKQETDLEHFESSFLQNMLLDNFSEETIVTESWVEGDGLCESVQCKQAECSETEKETDGENFESSFSQYMFHGNFSEETIVTENWNVGDSFSENAGLSQTNVFEESDLPFPETINMSLTDDWLLTNVYHDYSVEAVIERPTEIKNIMKNSEDNCINTFLEDAIQILEDYETTAYKLFEKTPEKEERYVEFHFGSIEKYCKILKGKVILTKKEKEYILGNVPKQFQNVPELKRKVKRLLKAENNITKEIKDELYKLNLKNKEIKEITENIKFRLVDDADRIVDSARDYFSELKVMMESNEIDKNNCELLCKNLKIPDDTKNILLKLVPGSNKKIPGNQFEFIRNRIKMLKKILIDDNYAIQQLWERATTPRRKMHVKEKIVQVYLNDSEIQASVETLLFDCMTILSSKELRHLWKKTSNLFNGVNTRNVLAHGHPLLESLGRLLDPYDLPSELVEKMVKLISDECILDCIQQILEQSGTDFSGFMQIMNDEEDKQYKKIRDQILECDQWKEYALLIPIREVRSI